MKRLVEIALGVVTSVGGFLEIGSIATAAQAGAEHRFRLLWAIVLGTICLIFLVEMSGRLAAVSQHTVTDALRDRFGFGVFLLTLVMVGLSSLLVLGAEIGGVSLALQLATGVSFPWWALPVGFAVWLVLWKGTFGAIEYGVSILGLVTVVFLVAAIRLHPPVAAVAGGALPRWPAHDGGRYWFLAVSILGATLTPYLFYFYSSGAIEDGWDAGYVGVNRVIATIGMSFGGVLSGAVLVVAAVVFAPAGIAVDSYEQVPLLLTSEFGAWGFWLFTASLGIACFGAALEISLALAYLVAQGLGWEWGKGLQPREAARFSATYTGLVIVASLFAASGVDPLKLTNVSMALTSAILPVAVVPFLVLMNDRNYLGEHVNGWLDNGVVAVVLGLAFVLAVVSIPLELIGS